MTEIPDRLINASSAEPDFEVPKGEFALGGGYSSERRTRSGFGAAGFTVTDFGGGYIKSHKPDFAFKKAETGKTDFSAGDRVKHKAFGSGLVLDASPVGGDVLLTIAFDSAGTKKLMAKFAKLEKE